MKHHFRLVHAQARHGAIEAIRNAPDGYIVTIKEPTRTIEQNAKLHAIFSSLAKSGLTWAGKPRTLEQWKVLLVSGHAIATKQGAEMVPGIENEFVNIRESTAAMSKPRLASLIEYAEAFCAQNGIETVHQTPELAYD
jgi:hypothetical protein